MQSVDDDTPPRGKTLTRCIGVIFVDSVKVLTGEKEFLRVNNQIGRGERKKTYLKNTKREKIRLDVYMILKRDRIAISSGYLILAKLNFDNFRSEYVQEFVLQVLAS